MGVFWETSVNEQVAGIWLSDKREKIIFLPRDRGAKSVRGAPFLHCFLIMLIKRNIFRKIKSWFSSKTSMQIDIKKTFKYNIILCWSSYQFDMKKYDLLRSPNGGVSHDHRSSSRYFKFFDRLLTWVTYKNTWPKWRPYFCALVRKISRICFYWNASRNK